MNNLLTPYHLSLELSMPKGLIYQLEKDGLPVLYVGNIKRYDLSDVKQWLRKYYEKYKQVEEMYHYYVV